MSIWEEFQRRNVVRVGLAYLAFAWLVVQIADTVLPAFDSTETSLRGLIIAFGLGFPIVLACAWIYDLTPDGIERTADAVPGESPVYHRGRILDFVIIGFLSMALITVVVDQYILDPQPLYESIAVLPFQSIAGGDGDEDYFADGMTEALTASLAKIESVRVISRTSAMQFKDSNLSLPEIANRLGASVIVEASVQQSDGRVLITAQLVDGETDEHLWAETFDRDFQDVLLLQSEIAQEIASQIQASITPEEQRRFDTSGTVNPDAYNAYLRGQQHFSRMTAVELEIAENYFEQALEYQEDFAQAIAGIGLTWVGRALNQVVPNRVAGPLARGFAERARQINPQLPEVHMALSSASWLEGELEESERHARRALELQPSYPNAWAALANVHLIRREYSQAAEDMRVAIDLDPFNPFYRNVLGTALLGARDCDASVSVLNESRRLFPNLPNQLPLLVACLHYSGRFDEVIEAEREWLRLMGYSEAAAAFEIGLVDGGYERAMQQSALVLERQALLTGTGSVEVAAHFGRADDEEKTLEWLQRGIELADPAMSNVINLPMYDLVRDDPRFQTLLDRLSN